MYNAFPATFGAFSNPIGILAIYPIVTSLAAWDPIYYKMGWYTVEVNPYVEEAPQASSKKAPIEKPIKSSGHIRIMKGNFCPDGAVAKITGKEGLSFTGPARCFDSEEDMLRGLENKEIQKGDVIIIRYEGPQGGPALTVNTAAAPPDNAARVGVRVLDGWVLDEAPP